MNDLGLKDFFISSRKEKYKLRRFFRELRWELRYAWRRAWRGYDDVDFFECFEMFRRRMIRILEDFINYGNGLLNLPQESEHYNELLKKFPEGYFDDENTKLIYQTMHKTQKTKVQVLIDGELKECALIFTNNGSDFHLEPVK